MKVFQYLMLVTLLLVAAAVTAKGKVRNFLFMLSGIFFIAVIVMAGILINNGTLRN